MFVEFEQLRFRNILSYGNRWTTLDFNSGLNLIKAQNGSGKSTILDAINFCLFGKPFRNIKINQLINKYNGKDLVVEISFKIGNDRYTIVRGLKPTLFSLIKNGEEIDNLSSKRLNQEEVDKLLGINERLFKNIVGIAVTNNKPFLTMSIADKRSLIESIFNIDVLTSMAKEVKKRDAMNKSEQRIKMTELNGLEVNVSDNKGYIEKINNYIAKFDETKAQNVAALESSIGSYQNVIAEQEKHVKDGKAAIDKLKGSVEAPGIDEFTVVNTKIGSASHELRTMKNTLDEINGVAVCPICGEELTDERAVKHFEEIREKIKKIETEILPALAKQQADLNARKKKYDELTSRVNLISQKVIAEEVKLQTNETQLAELQKQLEECKAKTCDFTTAEYEVKLAELTEKVNALTAEINDLDHKIAVDTKLIDILGDEGLRMYFFKKLLPILNSRINYYLHKFELAVQLEFDPYMEEKITTGRFEQDYNQFSGGEKSRIDMAILLSFFDISKMISNWSCSILFIDEVMDAGVDNSGTEQFLSTLYNLVTENDKNLGIYLISHKLSDIQINWNEIIEIEKKSLFSELKKGK